jgi:Zn-dependent M28 family amino/carboxypeptidase
VPMDESVSRNLSDSLVAHVHYLSTVNPARHCLNPDSQEKCLKYIGDQWREFGLIPVEQEFTAASQTYKNLHTYFGPETADRIVVGAHFDVCGDQPGADDNASGVAGIIELGRLLSARKPKLSHRIDLVAFNLEEPPFFGTEEMGSFAYAKSLKKSGVRVKAMLSLEMIGYFTEKPNSQSFPVPFLKPFYPDRGNFIAVIGNLSGLTLVGRIKKLMREHSSITVCSLNSPSLLPGVDFSDNRSFWKNGYPAVMITDTSFYRNPHYHLTTDTIDTLDFKSMSEVVNGVYGAITGF